MNYIGFQKTGKKKYKISGDQIIKFIERDNKIYAVAGLAHLTMSSGSIIEIKKKKKKWVAKEYLKLPTAPNAIQIDNNENFIIVTSSSLISVDKRAAIDILVDVGVWDVYNQLYPSSLIIHNNVVYIGMRKGVYKFDLSTKTEEWLLPE